MKRHLSHLAAALEAWSSSEATCQRILGDNKILRRQVRQMVREAEHNESSLRRFQALELDLLGCDSLAGLLGLLLRDAPIRCEWDRISLFLLDPEYEIRRLIDHGGPDRVVSSDLAFIDTAVRLDALYDGGTDSPRLGPYLSNLHDDLFEAKGARIASVALLPIRRQGRLFGSYNLGSFHPGRFPRNAASDFLHHLAAVIAACLEIAVTRERLQHLGLADALTGVNNRRFFDQRLPEEIARNRRSGTPLSCLLIDVDHFKNFNDRYGHQAGDHALRGVAQLVRSLLRRSDIFARFGGEEFAVLLPETGQAAAAIIAERIRHRAESARFAIGGGLNASVTLSIGVATLEPESADREPASLRVRLVEAADRGLYRAKGNGRNRVAVQALG